MLTGTMIGAGMGALKTFALKLSKELALDQLLSGVDPKGEVIGVLASLRNWIGFNPARISAWISRLKGSSSGEGVDILSSNEITVSPELLTARFSGLSQETRRIIDSVLSSCSGITEKIYGLTDEIRRMGDVSGCDLFKYVKLLNERSELRLQQQKKVLSILGNPHGESSSLGINVKGTDELSQFAKNEFMPLINNVVSNKLEMSHSVDLKVVGKGVRPFCNDSEIVLDMGSSFDRQMAKMTHETMHYLEDSNPWIAERCQAFLEYRCAGEKSQPLRALTGFDDYEINETARPDHFFDPYCGKDYLHKGVRVGTEILSMGVERLIKDPIGFFADDPEYFNFCVNTLKGIEGGSVV